MHFRLLISLFVVEVSFELPTTFEPNECLNGGAFLKVSNASDYVKSQSPNENVIRIKGEHLPIGCHALKPK